MSVRKGQLRVPHHSPPTPPCFTSIACTVCLTRTLCYPFTLSGASSLSASVMFSYQHVRSPPRVILYYVTSDWAGLVNHSVPGRILSKMEAPALLLQKKALAYGFIHELITSVGLHDQVASNFRRWLTLLRKLQQ